MRTLRLLVIYLCSGPLLADNLVSLYQRAVTASPELSGSQYALDIAKAREDQAFGELLPKVSINGNFSLNKFHSKRTDLSAAGDSEYEGRRASVNARQPVFDARAYLMMKSQEEATAQSEEELQAAHQKLILDLIDRYVETLVANDKREIIAAELESTEKQQARVESMQARQLALITDVYQIQARTETLRTELLDSENEAKIALEKLRELTGDAVDSVQPVRLDFNQKPPDNNVTAWLQDIGKLNPELQAIKHEIESARQNIGAQNAGHLPRVELQVSGSYSDTAFNNRQSPPFDVGTLAIEATIPLYEGGITEARVREAQARKGYTEARREQKLRELEKETRQAYLDMTSSPARSLAADRQLQASEKSRDAMVEGYELGVISIVDVLKAEQELSEARRTQKETRYRYLKARSKLLFQTGRLTADELTKLNGFLAAR